MHYDEFKSYLTRYLWKVGDKALVDDLDNLITQGQASINRDLREEYRHTSVNMLVTEQRMPLPYDYFSIRQVVDIDGTLGEFKYVSPALLETKRTLTKHWQAVYSIEANSIMFAGPTTGGRTSVGPTPPSNPTANDLWSRTGTAPGLYRWTVDANSSQWVQLTTDEAVEEINAMDRNIVIHYMRRVTGYKETGASWLTEDNLDLLVYATLQHTAPFLREDTRVPLWESKYEKIIMRMNENSAHAKERGVYGALPLSRAAGGVTRRGNRR